MIFFLLYSRLFNSSERTTIMSILQGVGMVFFPLMEFVGGQLFKYGGYYAVFGSSIGATITGLIYIRFIPETVTQRSGNTDRELEKSTAKHFIPWYKKLYNLFVTGNKQLLDSGRYMKHTLNPKHIP
jgi:MFS family permease